MSDIASVKEAVTYLLRNSTAACKYHDGGRRRHGVSGDDHDDEMRIATWERRWVDGDRGFCDSCRGAAMWQAAVGVKTYCDECRDEMLRGGKWDRGDFVPVPGAEEARAALEVLKATEDGP